ncbi:MAG: tRNA (adenosine(37)-N6)-threonylcarbamoyltransferase complex ATPase subunit type 1 TsaE, partial [Patescibacteria group bacterium]
MQTFISASSGQTKKIAADLAKKINNLPSARKNAVVLALQGDLGAGKTTFTQGLARALGIKEKILSPTFVLMKKFPTAKRRGPAKGGKFSNFYHFDCYRIQKPEEILSLGWQEIVKNPENIVAIEWPEKIKKLLPKNTIWLKFEYKD